MLSFVKGDEISTTQKNFLSGARDLISSPNLLNKPNVTKYFTSYVINLPRWNVLKDARISNLLFSLLTGLGQQLPLGNYRAIQYAQCQSAQSLDNSMVGLARDRDRQGSNKWWRTVKKGYQD
jgi:hypothetical protein